MKFDSLIQKIGEMRLFGGKQADAIAEPTLSDGERFPYGPFRFKVQLPKNWAYAVQASTDLQNWNAVSKGVSEGETLEYTDTEAAKFSHRFYRLLVGQTLSANVLGFVSITLPPGFSMIANPLNGGRNTVGELFKDWPEDTTLNKFDTRFFQLTDNGVKFKQWLKPEEKLIPGEGAIFFNPTPEYKSVSFVGEAGQGSLSVPIPAGFSIRSSLVPRPGNLEDLGFPISDGDVIHLFDRDRQKYVLHPYEGGKWTAGPPIVGLGESFWVAKKEPGTWTRQAILQSAPTTA